MHTDLTHATGLMGIASYFFGRLEDPNASDNNLSTLTSKSVLLSIFYILLINILNWEETEIWYCFLLFNIFRGNNLNLRNIFVISFGVIY